MGSPTRRVADHVIVVNRRKVRPAIGIPSKHVAVKTLDRRLLRCLQPSQERGVDT